jgi:hypothetical protein
LNVDETDSGDIVNGADLGGTITMQLQGSA